ncbi:MAG: hypothetical protein JW893_04835 [Candidatus Omnitrophica bacterium]|nr:hypothetical protein [Candidatus Omnitrophota bacterium]
MKKSIFFLLVIFLLSGSNWVLAASENESSDPSFSTPTSTFEASKGVQYFGTTGAQTIEHKNVSVDDTRLSDDEDIFPERTEFEMKNKITVMNNMGSSSSGEIYGSEGLESMTGAPVEKEGVVEIPYGESVRFNTGGMEVLEKKKRPGVDARIQEEEAADVESEEEPTAKPKASTGPRVLVA